jgi:hypothetical protein
MNAPEVIQPQRRCYGAIIALSVDARNPAWMFVGFRHGEDIENYEVPDLDLYALLSRYLLSAARARLAGVQARELTIWREKDGSWQVESE